MFRLEKLNFGQMFQTSSIHFAPFALPVELRVNDKVFRRFAVNVEIEAFAEILVADKDLAVNTKLSNRGCSA